MTQTLHGILEQYREDARNTRDLGDRFERMMYRFFEVDPIYADRFSKIWMWNDWPGKGKVGDVGIDLVAQDRATGEYCAIQCKFYLPEHTLSKGNIDSYFTALGREAFTSGIIVSTTDKWGKNALDALAHYPRVTRIGVHDLTASPVDWSTFDPRRPQDLQQREKKTLRPHQQEALDDVLAGLADADRGKLVMACGTGKTFAALKIAEAIAHNGHVLFLVPSLSLLAQSLREWTAEAEHTIHALAVCSDPNIGKSRKQNADDNAEITIHDLAFPATTNAEQLVAHHKALTAKAKASTTGDPCAAQTTVVFSTYHSIEAVSKAQKAGLPDFDLIICDEAHRTTGVTLATEDESHFVKVHDADFIRARKRLYMTATPRIYGDDAKSKAKEASAELCSMDDADLFGEELHRLGFGEAVGHSLLSDYKVLVLAVDEKYVATTFQRQIADANSELNLDDAVRITGCWNGLEKRFEALRTNPDVQGDVQPMQRAVAFSRRIKDSKAFVQKCAHIIEAYKEAHPDDDNLLEVEAEHVDGTFDALKRGALLDWLKADTAANTCRILSNARCLSEGVDVPALDAVMFLNPRNSVIDVVQSVGRVMRRAEGKRFGYIILPIGIPVDMKPEDALKDNQKYKIVWQVLQALRAHDDRFNATINQIELNRERPDSIQVIGVGDPNDTGDGDRGGSGSDGESKPKVRQVQGAFAFPELDEWKDAIYAKMVRKVGDRAYWETWARDIAAIADRHITRIKALLDGKDGKHAETFTKFLAGLRANLNPAIAADDAIEMLAQHSITKPVFDAIFADYAFTHHNPVSQSMQTMLDLLHEESIEKETETLDKFYASVRDRAKGIDNPEGRQRVVIELYEEFFKNAFPRMAERLGIVYTPVEVVDFIIHSVQDILREEFDSGLGEKDVHIIDPFTGTGTFLVRLLQSGFIPTDTLAHKYQHELHANEIVLLAYYIAAINIEETYHGLRERREDEEVAYEPFDGIVLTDTFQLYETQHDVQSKFAGHFPENTARAQRQQEAPIRVVIANPPYSAGQRSENDANRNLAYEALDRRIESTYVARTQATSRTRVYDAYIRAIRWASDRIHDRGVIGFVSNGSFIDGNSMDGLRACLVDEFTNIYVFNLRGNQRTSGDLSKREGGKIFGSGSRAPIAITLLVRNPARMPPATVHYHDIGDYLNRAEKLCRIRHCASINGLAKHASWKQIRPNEDHDWINQRDPAFDSFIPLGDKRTKGDPNARTVFVSYSLSVNTNRDAWACNYSANAVLANMERMAEVYDEEVARYAEVAEDDPGIDIHTFVEADPKKIKWTRELKERVKAGRTSPQITEERLAECMYRPFSRQWLYYDRMFVSQMYQTPKIFPSPETRHLCILISGLGDKEASCLITDRIGNLNCMHSGCQAFPIEIATPGSSPSEPRLIEDTDESVSNVSEFALRTFCDAYGKTVTGEDIFYYIYGVLHSPEYRERFAADLKKMLPRIPLTKESKDFRSFSRAGHDLADLHLNYQTIDPWPVVENSEELGLDPYEHFKVKKMTFSRPTKQQKAQGLKHDKTRIIYNSHVTLSHIPLEAYHYIVNGKPAIEWIMERYQVTRDKASGIVNDPNDWCREHDQPRHIIDLLHRIIRVSMETMEVVNGLPALNER